MSKEQLPTKWVSARLEQICDVVRGITFPSSAKENEHASTNVCCLRTSNIQHELDWGDVYYVSRSYVKREDQFVESGDVLMSMANSSELVGKVALVRSLPCATAFGAFLAAVRPRGTIQSEYLYHLLRTNEVKQKLRQGSSQTVNIANISARSLATVEVALAPLPEQKRIVKKIEDLQSRSKRAREALESVPALIEKFRQSVLAAAFRGDLTKEWREKNKDKIEPASELLKRIRIERRKKWEEGQLRKFKAAGKTPKDDTWKSKYKEPEAVDTEGLPELPWGWCWASVDEISSAKDPLCYGVVQPGDEEQGGGVPLVRVCDIGDGTISSGNLRTISSSIDEEYSRSRLRGGEVLVTIVGTIGRCAIVPPCLAGANIARAIAKLSVIEGLEPQWVLSALHSPYLQQKLVRSAREVARKTLNLSDLVQIPIPLAPSSELMVILKVIVAAQEQVAAVERATDAGSAQVNSLDQSILAKAFRGELVPQEPNDEPAFVLLERIRKEREKTEGKVGRRSGDMQAKGRGQKIQK
jgi:type I restriction enzyme S subunit